MNLSTPVKKLQFIGPVYASRLARLDIKTLEDLLFHFPSRYVDFSLVSQIWRVQPGELVTIRGQVIQIKNEYTRTGRKIQKAKVKDGTGEIDVVWFNQPFLVKTIFPGSWVSLSGKVDWFGRTLVLLSPEYELLKGRAFTLHTGRLVPIYPETSGLSSKWLRSRIAPLLGEALAKIEEFLPTEILDKYDLLGLSEALEQIHFPKILDEANKARKRLSFDELFFIQLRSLIRRKSWKKRRLAHKLRIDQEKVLEFLNNLPFELTFSQRRSCREILKDLAATEPMNRLLEGDVGSGKTVVAALASYIAYLNGLQTAFMAPTQILTMQHYQTLAKILSPLGVRVSLITSATSKKEAETLYTFNLILGTHALIQKNVDFKELGLIVIDEQQRFGVLQRGMLAKKGKGQTPHVLTMTATPIPRTVALTLYSDLDLSTLDELPAGRIRVKTWVVPTQKREASYNWIRKHVKDTDEQAFIVCPLIEESAVETMQSVRAATAEFESLSQRVFADLRLGLLHGRMKVHDKEEVMKKFASGGLDILVATPVVEVGIDMPNATIMMIEGAERFGLAQLHQLRGRVGRGTRQSYCLLFTESNSYKVLTRLKALEKTLSGAQLAELDLKLRGPGEIYGTRQHGFPELKIASFSDFALIRQTRQAAEEIFENLENYPSLKKYLSSQTEEIAMN